MIGRKKALGIAAGTLVVLAASGYTTWSSISREVPQPAWITATPRTNYLYGSLGSEDTVGIPYWIWLVLPRLFPQYLPGTGGYAALDLPWEETREMPAGLAKRTIGYVRVAATCALCHAVSRSNGRDTAPTVFAAGPSHSARLENLLSFYTRCAQDPSFNADVILGEVDLATRLPWIERMLYRYVLIPRTRQAFLEADSVLVDPALRQHARDPHADPGRFRQRLESLARALTGEEKELLLSYLSQR